jgi:hypothetical protein
VQIKDMFEVGVIMEDEEKAKSIKILDGDDSVITGKVLNKNKIILHMKRGEDGSEGNVFVRLNDANEKNFPVSKKLLASKKVVGLTLNELKNFEIENL